MKMTVKNMLAGSILAGAAMGMASGCMAVDKGAVETAKPAPVTAAPVAAPHAKDGFHAELDKDGRLWVFRAGSQELADFTAKGKPARHVVRPGAGPGGVTLKAVDSETIVEYLVARPGFHTTLDKDGRLWVFRAGSQELADFLAKGKPARHVVRPGAGPLGLTVKAVDTETLDAYRDAR